MKSIKFTTNLRLTPPSPPARPHWTTRWTWSSPHLNQHCTLGSTVRFLPRWWWGTRRCTRSVPLSLGCWCYRKSLEQQPTWRRYKFRRFLHWPGPELYSYKSHTHSQRKWRRGRWHPLGRRWPRLCRSPWPTQMNTCSRCNSMRFRGRHQGPRSRSKNRGNRRCCQSTHSSYR